jgi:hypothetical protein
MGRDNSALVTDDLMGLQLPPIRAPIAMIDDADGQVLQGAETIVEAQVNEEYEGDAESEDEASVVNDAEQCDESEDEVDVDMSDSRPKASALEERARSAPRVPRFNYVAMVRNRSDCDSRRELVRRLESDQQLLPSLGAVQDWLEMQSCQFGDAGFGWGSNALLDHENDLQEVDSGSNLGDIERVRAVKRKVRTERNPTMTNAFKTAEGADAWTPSVVKELTKIGPKHAFAMEQVDFWEIPSKAPILMLQVEHSRKKETNEMKTRLVVNGAQEPYKQDEDNYAPTALQKGGQLLFALAAQERRPMRGIDITCAFASESLTAEDGDIYVKYPDVLVK